MITMRANTWIQGLRRKIRAGNLKHSRLEERRSKGVALIELNIDKAIAANVRSNKIRAQLIKERKKIRERQRRMREEQK